MMLGPLCALWELAPCPVQLLSLSPPCAFLVFSLEMMLIHLNKCLRGPVCEAGCEACWANSCEPHFFLERLPLEWEVGQLQCIIYRALFQVTCLISLTI